jgi:hypothetical protein
MISLFNLGFTRRFEEELYCFLQIAPRLLDRVPLADHVNLRTERDVSIIFSLDYRRYVPNAFHFITS